MSHRLPALLAVGVLFATAPAWAQNPTGLDRRMDRIEQSVRALQAMVSQAQATGQPVVVRPEGPDPVLNAQQERIADLEQTLQRVNGQLDTLVFEVEQARRNEAAADADRRTAIQGLTERLARMETQLAALSSVVGPEIVSEAAADLGVATAATGTLNAQAGAPTAPATPAVPAPPANATEAFTQARALFDAGRHEAAGRAFEDFVARYPTSARGPEAYYWLGESYFARRGYQTATAAYASALRDNPTTTWAPAAMARLAQSLANSAQTAQACAALIQFDQRYAARASAAVKANAQTARTRAKCG